jgi:hypothetical protein
MLGVSNYYENPLEVSKTLQSISIDPQANLVPKSLIPVDNLSLSLPVKIISSLFVTILHKYYQNSQERWKGHRRTFLGGDVEKW